MMNPFDLKLTGGASGAANGTSSAGFADNFSTPFNFDSSGWIVNLGSSGISNSAQGNQDANGTKQSAAATPSQAQTLAGGSSFQMPSLPLLAIGAIVLVILLK